MIAINLTIAIIHVRAGAFDAPLAARGGGEPVPIRERAQAIPAFGTGVISTQDN
jgi:hypothetical protein